VTRRVYLSSALEDRGFSGRALFDHEGCSLLVGSTNEAHLPRLRQTRVRFSGIEVIDLAPSDWVEPKPGTEVTDELLNFAFRQFLKGLSAQPALLHDLYRCAFNRGREAGVDETKLAFRNLLGIYR
jgi:hypothetical protein